MYYGCIIFFLAIISFFWFYFASKSETGYGAIKDENNVLKSTNSPYHHNCGLPDKFMHAEFISHQHLKIFFFQFS